MSDSFLDYVAHRIAFWYVLNDIKTYEKDWEAEAAEYAEAYSEIYSDY